MDPKPILANWHCSFQDVAAFRRLLALGAPRHGQVLSNSARERLGDKIIPHCGCENAKAMNNAAKRKLAERQPVSASALEEAERLGLVGVVKGGPVDVAEHHSRYLKAKLRAKAQRPG